MDPLSTLQSIITLANMIREQVKLVNSNRKKLDDLAETMQHVIASLEGLSELPRNKQFVDSLHALQIHLSATHASIKKFSEDTAIAGINRFIYAGSYEKKIDDFKKRILELVPLLNIGLVAQQLIDRERDRCNEEADRRELAAKQEACFRAAQAAHLNEVDLARIVRQQMQSLEEQLRHQVQPVTPLSEKYSLSKEFQVNLSDIVFQNKIGNSDIGMLYHGTWREQPVTIKWLEKLNGEEERDHFMREAKVMSRLHNEYITPFYGACFEETRLCLLMGVMEKGSLSQALPTLSLQERFRMAQDLARGLAYLHDQEIVHGDIKPDHIGINQYNQAKWNDFGLVKTRAISIGSIAKVSQDARWQAPESWQRRAKISPASDVYSFGLLLWTLVTGRLPYSTLKDHDIIAQVKSGWRETISADVHHDLANLIAACWSANTSARPTARDIARTLLSISITPRPVSPSGAELYQLANKAFEEGNEKIASRLYERSYEKNYVKALTSIGLFKLHGLANFPVDKKAAIDAFMRAAEGGHARAMYNLGYLYETGDTPTGHPDYPSALHWYEKAVQADPTDAQSQKKVTLLRDANKVTLKFP